MGRVGNKVAFIWGALPGEEVEFQVIRKKKNFIEGVAKNFISTSDKRVEPKCDHYLSCAPWQSLQYSEENKWKEIMAEETYERIAGLKDLKLKILSPQDPYGYRNKMEYNFGINREGKLSFAFHFRGTHNLRPIENCLLADPVVKKASEEVLGWLRQEKVELPELKSLVVRSEKGGKAAAALFVKNRNFKKRLQNFNNFEVLKGLQIYYSYPLSPASNPTELISSTGDHSLEHEINGVKFKFGLLSFFQINLPVFEMALLGISKHINGGRVVDYYCGVGAIGLALHNNWSEALLVEENAEAANYAHANIEANGISNAKALHSFAERAKSPISKEDTVILDPPRAGLHGDLIRELLEKEPKKIIYLSCGLDTHARDISMMLQKYRPVDWQLFNFFPRTPHIEGLCVLERI